MVIFPDRRWRKRHAKSQASAFEVRRASCFSPLELESPPLQQATQAISPTHPNIYYRFYFKSLHSFPLAGRSLQSVRWKVLPRPDRET
ncbi:hypothetical protein CHELA20_50809 [Hyphomicrobiales bacterium]|nr:hypothetical protein CHELA20_50809 [Hyphomicrobiales bacterium]CAH1676156.1 hypothetical protein CHELA41_24210 [Hyphomicrobiales bacterium]